jgi:shikimate dehydrogenase
MTNPYRVKLFGYPVGHSVSPDMHQSAAEALGIRIEYTAQQVTAEQLPRAVEALRGPEFLGANVTLPHKPSVLALLDQISPLARRIGAVNTVYKAGGLLVGDNTDAAAVVRCLKEGLAFSPVDDPVLLLGAGGAARGVAVGLLDAGARRIAVWNRTEGRARLLVEDLARSTPSASTSLSVVTDLDAALERCTLLVNATSVGLDDRSVPVTLAMLGSEARVFDLVYGTAATPLVREARSRGLCAEDGLWMLVHQAAAAFTLWTGVAPPEDVMYAAALRAFRRRDPVTPSDGAPERTL